MTVMQIRCDRCGKSMETERHEIPLQWRPRPASLPRDSATSDPAINLCEPCFDDLHEWFDGSDKLIPDDRCTLSPEPMVEDKMSRLMGWVPVSHCQTRRLLRSC